MADSTPQTGNALTDELPYLLQNPGETADGSAPTPSEVYEDATPPILSRPVVPEDLAPEQEDALTGPDPVDNALDQAVPPPPDHIAQAALLAGDHWFALVDPAWTQAWPPPEWTVVGEWRSDASGEIVEWRHNPSYVRSPAARGWARPTDPTDAAVQRAAAGYGREDEVPDLLAPADVAVLVGPDGRPVTAVAPDGTPVMLVFTSQAHLAGAGRLLYEIHTVSDLAEQLPEDHQLYLNCSAPVSMCVEPDALDRALARVRTKAETLDTSQDSAPAPAPGPDGGPEEDSEPSVGSASSIETTGSTPGPLASTPRFEPSEPSEPSEPLEEPERSEQPKQPKQSEQSADVAEARSADSTDAPEAPEPPNAPPAPPSNTLSESVASALMTTRGR
ncbi:type VII secretion system-associated protein [Streptomyces sp. NPDC087844]|uniref:type VII secretion system-associated protein n=1 Tax=Streptomyces sp. NPDC087844 TaxID=3365805 RepID=UPI00382AB2F1